MYEQMYYDYYDGYPNMPFQQSAVPPYRQQPFQMMNRRNGWQRPQVIPYVNPIPFPNYPLQPEINPHFYPAVNGYQQDVMYPQQNGTNMEYVFQNPLNPSEHHTMHTKQQRPPNGVPYMNPYPKGSFMAKQPSGMKSVLNSFKAQDGSLDLNKMVDTAGQMMNAVSQVSSVVKGFGGMFKA